jgi:hypothetical protein
MDLPKYPLERVFHLAAGVIPGFVALLIFEISHPRTFGWLFGSGFLGYRTKLTITLVAAFVVGNTMTAFLSGLLGALGGWIGSVMARRLNWPSSSYKVAPWREPRWRALLRKHLGAAIADDTLPMSQEIYDFRARLIEALPESERRTATVSLMTERNQTFLDDSLWKQRYDHYHEVVLKEVDQTFEFYVARGLNYNLETAALWVLISATVVPQVRHWWFILPACVWVLVLVAETFRAWHRYIEKWGTLSEQLTYLMRKEPALEGNHPAP